MEKTKNLKTLQIEEEFKKYEYHLSQRFICHILNIEKLTKAILLQIAKEMKEKRLISLSRVEQSYSAALKLWLCRNINLVYDYLSNRRFENFPLDFPIENTQEYTTECYLNFDEIVSQPKEINLEKKICDPQDEEFNLQRNENQKKIIEINFQSENLDFFSFEFIQEFKL
jgi:hypothetical protein